MTTHGPQLHIILYAVPNGKKYVFVCDLGLFIILIKVLYLQLLLFLAYASIGHTPNKYSFYFLINAYVIITTLLYIYPTLIVIQQRLVMIFFYKQNLLL